MSGRTRTVTSESVLAAAVRITEKQGLSNLNIHQLAAELGLKPASLYNHIKGINEVKVNVSKYAINELNKVTRDAAIGYAHEEALFRIACALRNFAAKCPELYNAINLFSTTSPEEYKKMLGLHLNVLHQILDTYKLDDDVKTHFLHAFRSALHGFASLEAVGAFGDNADMDESFRRMTVHLIKMLEGTANDKKN